MENYSGFKAVDARSERAFFFDFLDAANAEPGVRRYRDRMVELCPVGEGDRVLEVGCGLGDEARRLAERVGGAGRVVAIDTADAMIAEARRRTADVELPVEYRLGDIHALDAVDGAFDLVRAEKVLLYVDDPPLAVGEMARVTRPGGSVVAFDFDFRGYMIDSNLQALTRRIEDILLADVPNGLIARQLPSLFRQAGLAVRAIEPWPIMPSPAMARFVFAGPLETAKRKGLLSEDELRTWWDDQDRMEREGDACSVHMGYVIAGEKV